jgi:hypothetical protein
LSAQNAADDDRSLIDKPGRLLPFLDKIALQHADVIAPSRNNHEIRPSSCSSIYNYWQFAMRHHCISSATAILHGMSVSRQSWRVILPLQSAIQPLVLRAPLGVRNYSIFEDWKGSSAEEHIRKRSEKGDTDDVHSEAAASGLRERRANQGLADETKSQGMTERGGTKYGKKAKEEHPKAPEPVIGMNDERPKVSSYE